MASVEITDAGLPAPQIDVLEGGGLNSGAELDDELAPTDLFTAPTMGEVPDLKEDVTVFAALEGQISDLVYLRESIQSAGGMNQSFALEAQQLIVGFGGIPVGFYTKDLTATRFKLSLEEISKTIWALIAAVAAAVVAMIFKLYSWLSGKKDGKNGTPESTDKAIDAKIEKVGAVGDAISETNDLMQEATKAADSAPIEVIDDDGKKTEFRSAGDLVDSFVAKDKHSEEAENFLQSKDPLFHDLIKNGPYSVELIKVGNLLSDISSKVMEKASLLENVLKSSTSGSAKDITVDKRTLAKLSSTPIEVTLSGRTTQLPDLVDRLSDLRTTTKSAKTRERITFNRLLETLERSFKGEAYVKLYEQQRRGIKDLDALKTKMEEFEVLVGRFSTDGMPDEVGKEIGNSARQALMSIRKDLTDLGRLFYEVETYTNNVQAISMHVTGFTEKMMMRVGETMKKSGHPNIEAFEQVTEKMKHKSKTLYNYLHGIFN